jgi:O-methyltransferase
VVIPEDNKAAKESMKNSLKRIIPRRWRRLYRKYVSPIVRDGHYYEYAGRRDFFRRAFTALSFNGIDGDYVEFGCCGGMTFGLAYKHSRKQKIFCRLWAFDSFCGLPPRSLPEDEHPAWVKGAMAIEKDEFRKICQENNMPESEYTIVAGYYEESLGGPDSGLLPANICLAYIDCDMYSSTKTVLEFLLPRLKHGMIIAFDDYYCWSAAQVSGERKACADVFRDNRVWTLVPLMQFGGGGGGMSFVVERRELGGTMGACY